MHHLFEGKHPVDIWRKVLQEQKTFNAIPQTAIGMQAEAATVRYHELNLKP